MAGLIRTSAGLSNAHLFYSGDFIVYCESEPDCGETMSWDVGFWEKIVGTFAPDFKVVFKPQGSRTAVIRIAEILADSSSHKSICLIDRDFSDIWGDPELPDFVVKTYGYSFENDVSDSIIITKSVCAAMPGRCPEGDVLEIVEKALAEVASDIRWGVMADQILSLYYLSFFDRKREKFKSVFDSGKYYSIPKLSRHLSRERIRHLRGIILVGRSISKPQLDFDVWRRFYGHACWWVTMRIASNTMRALGHSGKITPDLFGTFLLTFLKSRLSDSSWHISKYYETEIDRAFKAAA